MHFDWVGKINWVDILFILVLIRAVYIGLKRKLVVEFFKSIGVLFAIFFSLHYYSRLGALISNNSALPLDIAKTVSLVFLVFVTILAFRLILEGVLLLFRIEPRGFLDRWGAALFSVLRGVLICSLIGVLFIASAVNYLEFSVRQSFLGSRLTSVAPIVYRYAYIHVVSKFFPDEPLNYDVFDVIEKRGSSGEEI